MKAIIVVDTQVDFCEGGSLAVTGGAEVARKINLHLQQDQESLVVFTQDWHIDPGDHFSETPDFIDSWPVHCQADTEGAAIHPNLTATPDAWVRKGMHSAAYSGFEGTVLGLSVWGGASGSLLEGLLAMGVREVEVCGLALDYCVKATALDAAHYGFRTRVLKDLTAAVHQDRLPEVYATLIDSGVEIA